MTLKQFMLSTATSQLVRIQIKENSIDLNMEDTVNPRDFLLSRAERYLKLRSYFSQWEVHCIRVDNGTLTIDVTPAV